MSYQQKRYSDWQRKNAEKDFGDTNGYVRNVQRENAGFAKKEKMLTKAFTRRNLPHVWNVQFTLPVSRGKVGIASPCKKRCLRLEARQHNRDTAKLFQADNKQMAIHKTLQKRLRVRIEK